jgi:hypothetical protein
VRTVLKRYAFVRVSSNPASESKHDIIRQRALGLATPDNVDAATRQRIGNDRRRTLTPGHRSQQHDMALAQLYTWDSRGNAEGATHASRY